MKNKFLKSKAVEIIKTLSKEERKQFELFLSSPYFNTNLNITKLYKEALKSIDRAGSDPAGEKEVYEKIFKGKTFNYGTMRNLMSTMYRLCEEFLIINSTRENPENAFENDIKLLTEYSKRSLDTHFKLKYKKTDNETQYSLPGYSYFDKKSKLIYAQHIFDYQRSKLSKYKDTLYPIGSFNLAKVISILSEDVAAHNFLKTTQNYNPNPNVPALFFKNLNFESFLDEIKNIDKICYDHLNLEFKHIKLYTDPDNLDNYFELKKIISMNIDKFSNSDRNYLIAKLLMFVTRLYNEGNEKLIYELSDLRKLQLRKVKFGTENNNSLPLYIFTEIINLFLMTEDIRTVEDFINGFVDSVEKVNRKTALQYGVCRIEMIKGNYEKALEIVREIELTNVHHKYQVRMLNLEIYYELGYFEAGISMIDAVRHTLKKITDINPQVKKRYTYLLGVMEKIYKIKTNQENYSLEDLELLVQDISKKTRRSNNWYIRKLDELRTGYEKKTGSVYTAFKKI